MKFWRLELDYDEMPREEVDKDAKRLIADHPELGNDYRIEPSPKRDHYHVIFLKSQFKTFQDAFEIALDSECDKTWLTLCKEYQCFGLETEAARSDNIKRQQQIVNKPSQMLFQSFILDLEPTTSLDGRRIVKVCEAIKDSEWEYKAFTHIITLKPHVLIGCRDEAQATRRMKWLSEQGLNFTATVKPNSQTQT